MCRVNTIRPLGSSAPPHPADPEPLPDVTTPRAINKSYCTAKLCADYAHVGLHDVSAREVWIARNRWRTPASRVSHARLLKGGSNESSTADKDRFVCFWFHTPGTGEGLLQGYPIEWAEAHLVVRLDPNWSYSQQAFIPNSDTRRVEKNIDDQFTWAASLFKRYTELAPPFPLSYHLIGPRTTDSTFYVERVEP